MNTAPTRDQMQRFLKMSEEEAVEVRAAAVSEIARYRQRASVQEQSASSELARMLGRRPDGTWWSAQAAHEPTELEVTNARTWNDIPYQSRREIDVTDWVAGIAQPILDRNDDRARKLRFKQMTLLCRAGMTDDEFVKWTEDVLAVLLCAKS